jgi:hypothetical protein
MDHGWLFYAIRLIILIFLTWVTFIVAVKLVKQKVKIWLVALCISFCLTFLTIFFLQGHSVFFDAEATVIAKSEWLRKQLFQDKTGKHYIDTAIIFINTAENPILVDKINAYDLDSAKRAITNRYMLDSVLHMLAKRQSAIGLLTCDIVFEDSTACDKDLIDAMKLFQDSDKLALAYNSVFARNYESFYKSFDLSSFGNVTKTEDEPFYFSLKLLDDNQIPSLSYLMYLKLRGVKVKSLNSMLLTEPGGVAPNSFIPEFNFTDESVLYRKWSDISADNAIKTKMENDLKQIQSSSFFSLAELTTKDGVQALDDLLIQRSTKRNIIIIGNFSDNYLDKHATAFGSLHGVTIILNEFLCLLHGYHLYSVSMLIIYSITMLSLFTLMSKYLLQKKVVDTYRRICNPEVQNKKKKIIEWFEMMFEFIADEAHYVMIFIIAIILNILFNRLINIVGLLYFIVPISMLLRFTASKQSCAQSGSN